MAISIFGQIQIIKSVCSYQPDSVLSKLSKQNQIKGARFYRHQHPIHAPLSYFIQRSNTQALHHSDIRRSRDDIIPANGLSGL